MLFKMSIFTWKKKEKTLCHMCSVKVNHILPLAEMNRSVIFHQLKTTGNNISVINQQLLQSQDVVELSVCPPGGLTASSRDAASGKPAGSQSPGGWRRSWAPPTHSPLRPPPPTGSSRLRPAPLAPSAASSDRSSSPWG